MANGTSNITDRAAHPNEAAGGNDPKIITVNTGLLSFKGSPRQAMEVIDDLAHLEKFLGELSPILEHFNSALNEAYLQYEQSDKYFANEDYIRGQLMEDMGEVGVRVVASGVLTNVEMDTVD